MTPRIWHFNGDRDKAISHRGEALNRLFIHEQQRGKLPMLSSRTIPLEDGSTISIRTSEHFGITTQEIQIESPFVPPHVPQETPEPPVFVSEEPKVVVPVPEEYPIIEPPKVVFEEEETPPPPEVEIPQEKRRTPVIPVVEEVVPPPRLYVPAFQLNLSTAGWNGSCDAAHDYYPNDPLISGTRPGAYVANAGRMILGTSAWGSLQDAGNYKLFGWEELQAQGEYAMWDYGDTGETFDAIALRGGSPSSMRNHPTNAALAPYVEMVYEGGAHVGYKVVGNEDFAYASYVPSNLPGHNGATIVERLKTVCFLEEEITICNYNTPIGGSFRLKRYWCAQNIKEHRNFGTQPPSLVGLCYDYTNSPSLLDRTRYCFLLFYIDVAIDDWAEKDTVSATGNGWLSLYDVLSSATINYWNDPVGASWYTLEMKTSAYANCNGNIVHLYSDSQGSGYVGTKGAGVQPPHSSPYNHYLYGRNIYSDGSGTYVFWVYPTGSAQISSIMSGVFLGGTHHMAYNVSLNGSLTYDIPGYTPTLGQWIVMLDASKGSDQDA